MPMVEKIPRALVTKATKKGFVTSQTAMKVIPEKIKMVDAAEKSDPQAINAKIYVVSSTVFRYWRNFGSLNDPMTPYRNCMIVCIVLGM
mmetsp:Transcript_24764/g.36896  ORF Transcript_24764/g.36896 Transcript_24764/m.36896 type:complete len:89 (-) Transcript_24764:219-485(-)